MRRVSIITRAAASLFPAGLVVSVALGSLSAGQAAMQAPRAPNGPTDSQPSAEPSAEVLYARGWARLQAGDASAAIPLLAAAVAQRPDNLEYAIKLAKAQTVAGQTTAALQLLDGLAARRPEAVSLHVALAEVHASTGNWTPARETLAPMEEKLDADGRVLLASACAQTGQPARATALLQRGLEQWPDSETLWLALIDHTLEARQCGRALQRVHQARRHLAYSPQLEFRAARAYYRLGQALGQTRVLRIPHGQAGQFVDGWLLVEKRAEPDRFLCCPEASALYALRRALDAGLDEPAAHLLHARIWQQAGRPEVGLAILQSREALLLDRTPSTGAGSRRDGGPRLKDTTPEALATFADLALAANALTDFLRYARLQAARQPQRRTEILYDAFVAAAERYNQRGDDAMYRELLRRALALRTEDVELMLRLADALWDAGEVQAATIWYRRVLERQPTHRDRRRILKRLEG